MYQQKSSLRYVSINSCLTGMVDESTVVYLKRTIYQGFCREKILSINTSLVKGVYVVYIGFNNNIDMK